MYWCGWRKKKDSYEKEKKCATMQNRQKRDLGRRGNEGAHGKGMSAKERGGGEGRERERERDVARDA